jgi:hypothetical protein
VVTCVTTKRLTMNLQKYKGHLCAECSGVRVGLCQVKPGALHFVKAVTSQAEKERRTRFEEWVRRKDESLSEGEC